MIDCERSSDFPDLLVCLLSANHVVYAEHYAQKVPRALPLDSHGRPEASVQRCCDPCGAKVRTRVEVCEWFGAFEAEELAEVASNVQIDQRDEDRLPYGKLPGQKRRDAAEDRWSMAITSGVELAL
jgi:hypothetical protein